MPDPALTRTGLTPLLNSGADSTSIIRGNLRSLAAWLEGNAVAFAEGLDASRPTAGVHGRVYKPTDVTGVLYWDTGSTWETIGGAAATDAAANVGSLRTLGAGAQQAAPGDSTAAGIAVAASADLRDWARPGLEVPGLTTTVTSVSAGPTTVVAAPSSGRRVIKSLLLVPSAAGAVATLTWAGSTLGTIYFPSQAPGGIDVCLPQAFGETLAVTASGGTIGVVASYGDRSDSAVTRLGYAVSAAASGTLIPTGSGTRYVTMLWLANNSSSATATTTLTVAGTALPTISMPPRSILVLDEFAVTSVQQVTWAGDGTNSLTYLAVGR